ncbi:heat shock protein HslJ [Chitinophaga skermanii]|uniref:Heat shock protein HslJ n=1 Tax=Chitinophaga skermanii TaxID=331697 RepID=A0A327QPV7_9BACT|nr:META domain-containing protein [Chitinophaga skermanii]RAJ05383.1 heat shock protein HslJ [Chitinophaga skermanii]
MIRKQIMYIAALGLTAIVGMTACKSSAKTQNSGNNAGTSLTIYDKKWTLVEVNGKPVEKDPEARVQPYVIFSETDKRVSGNGGCNGFGGSFVLKGDNRIKMSQLISTMMACKNLDTEHQFMRALENADSYFIVNDTLILNRARMAPLARFVGDAK